MALIVLPQAGQAVADTPSHTQIKPGRCIGWQQTGKLQPVAVFSSANQVVTSGRGISTGSLDATDPNLACQGWTLAANQAARILGAHVIVNLRGSAPANTTDSLLIESSTDGTTWSVLKAVALTAVPTAPLQLDLPAKQARDLPHLILRLRPDFDPHSAVSTITLNSLYLDVQLQSSVTNPVTNKNANSKQLQKNLNSLTEFSKNLYSQSEQPLLTVPKVQKQKVLFFTVGQKTWTVKRVEAIDVDGHITPVQYHGQDVAAGSNTDTDLKLDTRGLHPGRYTIRVTTVDGDGNVTTVDKDFLWGVAAINVTHAMAKPGDNQVISLGVLDDSGRTICDAQITLTVKSPSGQTKHFSTENRTIDTNGVCVDKGVTNKPDYSVTYRVEEAGLYHVSMQAKTSAGERTVEETFQSDQALTFDVDRFDYPTRIYPLAAYPVHLAVTPSQDYTGFVREHIPADFKIEKTFPESSIQPATGDQAGNDILWPVNWQKGQTYFLSYTFDAPDISPALFLTGPLSIGKDFLAGADFTEPRQWQIASDAVAPNGWLLYADTTNAGQPKLQKLTSTATFGAEVSLNPTGTGTTTIFWSKVVQDPTSTEISLATLDSGGTLRVLRCSGTCDTAGNWTQLFSVASVTGAQTCSGTLTSCQAPFDLAYEQLSGRLIITYGKAASNDTVFYRIYDAGSQVTGETTLSLTLGTKPATFMTLKPQGERLEAARSNKMLLTVAGAGTTDASTQEVSAAIWDGSSAWGNTVNITATTKADACSVTRCADGAWETLTGDAQVMWSDTATDLRVRRFTGGSWAAEATSGVTKAGSGDNVWIDLSSDPASDRILLSEYNATGANFKDAVWKADGSTASWTNGNSDTTAESGPGQNAWGEWQKTGNAAVVAYGDAAAALSLTQDVVACTGSGCTFTKTAQTGSTATTVCTSGTSDDSNVLNAAPSWNSNEIMFTQTDIDSILYHRYWNGSAFDTFGSTNCRELTTPPSAASTFKSRTVSSFTYIPYAAWSTNWHFYNGTDTGALPTTSLANEDVTPTGFDGVAGKFRLRFAVTELAGGTQTDARKKLQYTTGSPDSSASTWTDVDAAGGSGIWRYVDCNGGTSTCDDNTAITGGVVLGGSPTAGWWNELGTGGTVTNMDHSGSTTRENEYSVEANNAGSLTTYYFRMYDTDQATPVYRQQTNNPASPCTGTIACTYPSVTTAAQTISVAGTCQAYDQSANCADLGDIRVAVNGTLQTQLDANGGNSGTFSIASVPKPNTGDVITVFVDGAASNADKAVAVTKYDGSGNIATMKLFKEHITIGSGDTPASISAADVGAYDNSVSADADIFDDYRTDYTDSNLTATGGAVTGLQVDKTGFSSQEELYIQSGWTFTPAAVVATHDLENAGGTLAMAANALTITGSYVSTGTLTKTAGSQTTTFTSASSGETITPGTGNFDSVTFNGSGGDWTPSAALNIDGALTMTAGQLKGTQNVTVVKDAVGTAGTINLTGGTFEQAVAASQNFGPTTTSTTWTFNNLTFSSSTGTPTVTTQSCTTCNVTVTGTLLVSKTGMGGTNITLNAGAGSTTWTLSATNNATPMVLTQKSGALTASSSTFTYSGNNGAGDVTIAAATYNNLTLGGGSAENYDASGATAVSGTTTVGANGSLIGTDAWTFKNLAVSGTVNLSTSGDTFNSTGSISGSGSITLSGGISITSSATTTVTAPVTVSSVSVSTGSTIDVQADMSVAGNFTNTGTGVITTTAGTPTILKTSGSGNIGGVSGSTTFYNLDWTNGAAGTFSSDITIKHNLDMTAASISAGSTTVTMNGSSGVLSGGNQTLANLTIANTSGTVTLQNSVLTVSTLLTVNASASLTIDTGQTLTLSRTATANSLSLNATGTITGAGRLTYQLPSSVATFPTTGTVSSVLRFDATTGTGQTVPERTYGGNVELYEANAGCPNRDFTFATTTAQTLNFSANLILQDNNCGGINVVSNTNNPTVNITGDLVGATTVAGNGDRIHAGGTWTISGNVALGQGGRFTGALSSMVNMTVNGTSKSFDTTGIPFSGTLTIDGSYASPGTGDDLADVAGTLVVNTGKSLTLNGTDTLYIMTTGTATLNGTGTITGAGTLSVQSSNLGTGGTLSSVVEFDPSSGDITMPARTYGSNVNIRMTVSTPTANQKVVLGALATQTIQGNLTVINDNATFGVTLDGATSNPALAITGNVAFTKNSTGTVAITSGTNSWTVGGNVNFTNGTYTAASGNTLEMTGTSKTLTSAGNALHNLTVSAGSVSASGATTVNGNVLISGGSFAGPAAAFTVAGNWTNSGGTYVEGTGTVTLNGTTSTTLNSGCSNTDSCANQNFYDLEINKTGVLDADDNVTLTSNGINVAHTLTITDGELVQGALNVRAEGTAAVAIAATGKWSNISTGDIKLGGTVVNDGLMYWDVGGNNDGCSGGDTDDIAVASTTGGAQRAWSGSGTFTFYDLTVSDQGGTAAITVNGGTSAGGNDTNWTINGCGVSVTGTIYQSGAEGSAYDCSGGNSIALHVSTNGGATKNGSCTAADGTFTITGVTDPGAADIPVAVFSDSASSNKLTTVTLSSGAGGISGLTLIIGRVVISQESATAMTNTLLKTADNGNTGIRYSVATAGTDNLTVESGLELHVLAGKSFIPGGTVLTTATGTTAGPAGDVHIPATAVLNMAGNALSVGGDLTNAGTLTVTGSQTTTMTATGSGFTLTSGGSTLRNLTFNGASGGWTNSGALTMAGDWTGTAGGFTQADSTTITVNGSAFSLANGFTWTKATSGANLILDNATNLDFTDSNTAKQNLGVLQAGASPGVTTLKSDLSADTVTVPTGDTYKTKGWDVTTTGAFACNGTCTLDMTDSAPNNETDGTILDIGGDFTMSSTGTLTADTGKVFMNSTAGANTNRTWTTGGKTYNLVELKNAGTSNDQVIISGNVVVTNTFTLTDGTIKADTNNPNTNTAGDVSIANAAAYVKGTGTWTFDGTTAKTYTDSTTTPQNIGAVAITKTNGVASNNKITLGSSMTVDTMTISASNTLDLASSGYTLKIANAGATGTVLTATGTLSPGTNSIVQFSATNSGGTVVVPATTYNNLKISGNETYDLGNNLTGGNAVSGGITIDTGGATLDTVSGSNFNIALAGDWTNNGVFTQRSGTVTLTGTANITGSTSTTFNNLTISGTTVTVPNTGSDITVGALLTVDTSKALTIATGRTVTLSNTGASALSLSGTINGPGKLIYRSSDVFPTTGALAAGLVLRYDMSVNNMTTAVRTDYGTIEAYNASGAGRTLTLGNGTHTLSGNFDMQSNAASSTLVVQDTNNIAVNVTGNVLASVATAAVTLSMGSNTWTVGGNFDLTNVTTFNNNSGTLTMNGTGTLTSHALTLFNVNLSGTISLASATHTINGNLSFASGTITPNTSTILMNGTAGKTLTGGNASIYALTIDPTSTATITLQTSDLTVTNQLTVATSDTLSIASGITLTNTFGTNIAITSAIISGSGTLRFVNGSGGPGSTGTISAGIRFDASAGDIASTTVDARTYRRVELYSNSASNRVITYPTGSFGCGGSPNSPMYLYADGTGNLTVDQSTSNPASIAICGDLDFVGGGSGTEILNAGTGTINVVRDVNFTDGTFTSTGTLNMQNSTSSNLTTGGSTLHNLTISNFNVVTLANETVTVSGNFDMTSGGVVPQSSSIVMTGTSNTFEGGGNLFYNVTIDPATTGTISVTSTTFYVSHNLTVAANDTLSIGSGMTAVVNDATATLTLNSGSVVSGAGQLWYQGSAAFPTAGTVDADLWFVGDVATPLIASARTYGGNVVFDHSQTTGTLQLGVNPGDTLNFSKSLEIRNDNGGAGTSIISGTTNNPIINITGDLIKEPGYAGLDALTIQTGTGTWTVSGNTDCTGITCTFASGNLLKMNGSSKTLTSAGNALSNFEVSANSTTMSGTTTVNGDLTISGGTLTGPSSGALNVGGTWTNNAAFTHNSSTVTMSGTSKNITGSASTTFDNLTISGTTTVAAGGSDTTVATLLTVNSAKSLTIGSGRLVTLSRNNASNSLIMTGGTINGPGTLVYQNGTANAFPTDGTLGSTSIIRFDTVNGDLNVTPRTDYGSVVAYKNSTTAHNVFLGTTTGQTLTLAGNLDVINGNATGGLTLDASTGPRNPTVNVSGNVTNSTATGATTISMGSGTWTVGGNFDLTNVTTFNNNSGTLVMNGVNKALTTNGKTFFNLTFSAPSGTTTLSDAVTAAGDVVLNSTITAGSLSMTGNKNLTGGTATLTNLTISGAPVTLISSNLTVGTTLNVADAKTLTITTVSLTLSGNSGTTLNLNTSGSVTGTGTLVYQNSATTVTTAGTISSAFIFDTVNTPLTIPSRTFGGLVTARNTTGSAGTVIFGTTVTPTFSAGFDMKTTGTGTLLVDGATNNPTTVTVTGNVTASAANGAITYSMGSGNWAVSGNFDLTNVTTLNHNSGTLTMTGTGTVTSNGKTLNNLTANGGGVVTIANAALALANNLTLTAGTLTISGTAAISMAGSLSLAAGGTFNANTSTITMTGTTKTIDGGGKTVSGLTISGNTTLQNTDLSVSGALAVSDSTTLTINASRNLTVTTAGSVNFNTSGIITSPSTGTLIYQPSTTFPTGGTISSQLRMDATSNNQGLSARTYGGQVELYNNSSTANRTFTLGTAGSQTLTFSSHLYSNAANKGDVLVDGSTNNPNLSITGDVDFTGSGDGVEAISAGSGTWTVGGNANFTDGFYGPQILTITPSWDEEAAQNNTYAAGCGFSSTIYNCAASGVTNQVGIADNQNNCDIGVPGGTYDDYRIGEEFDLSSYSASATVLNVGYSAYVTAANTQIVNFSSSSQNALSGQSCSSVWSIVNNVDYGGSNNFLATGTRLATLNSAAVSAVQSRIGTATHFSMGLMNGLVDAPATHNSDNATINKPALRISLYNSGSPTLIMNGSSKTLTVAGNPLYNLTLSGSITLANETVVLNGSLDMTGGTVTAGSTNTIQMKGSGKTITGGSQTLKNLQISGNTTLQTSDLTSTATVTIDASKSLTINNGITLTLSGNPSSLTLFGTLNGPGRLTYTNTSTTLTTNGTLASSLIVRFDTVNGNMTIPPRTDYGLIEAYGGSANARTLTLGNAGSQTITTSGNFLVMANAASPNNVTVQGATWDPTLNVGGDFDFTGTGTALEVVTAPDAAATWTVSGNVNLQDNQGSPQAGTWTASAETLVMNGASKTLTTAGNGLNNLTFSGTGTTTLADNVSAAGNVVLNSTISAGSTTLTLTGAGKNLTGGTATLNNLTLSGNTSLITSNLTVSGALTVAAAKTLTITTVTLTDSGASDVSWGDGSSTIAGTGLLTFTSSTTGGPGTGGVITVPVRFDASAANIPSAVFDARTYGGSTTLFANNASARSITAAAGAYTFSAALTIDAGGGAGTVTADLGAAAGTPAVSITGTLTIGVTTSFTAPASATMNVGTSFTNNGAFTHNSGTVALTTATAATITGSTTFNNLSISGIGAAKTITFVHATTTTVSGTWTVAGSAGNLITMDRDNTSAWTISPTAASVDYADVSWSNSGLAICATHSQTTNSNNNANWTISAGATCGVTVSGRIYTDDGSTGLDCTSARTVAVKVNGAGSYSASCSNSPSNGSFSIASVTIGATGDVVSVYISGATEKANTVTLAANTSSNITADLYQNRLIVSHESAGPITNSATTGLGKWDKDDDSTNFFYTANSNNLSLDAGKKLIVWTGKTYTPGGTVTTTATGTSGNPDGDLTVQSSATLSMGANALSVGGDLTNSGTFSKSATQTTSLTATSTGFTFTPGTGNYANLSVTGGGTYTAQAAVNLDEDLNVTSGTFALGANALTVGSTGATNSGNVKVASGQSLTQTSGSTTTIKSSASGANCIGSNGASCVGTVGTISLGGLTIGDGATTITTTFGGTTPSMTVANTLTVAANATFTAGASTLNVGGSFTNSGTFSQTGGTLVMNGTGTLTSGTATLNNFTTSGSGTVTFANAVHTLAGNLTIGTSNTITPGTSTIAMSGSGKTIDGGGKTIAKLTISDNTTVQTNDLTANNDLTVAAGKTLTIATVTLTHTGTNNVIWGDGTSTIAGTSTGTLRFTSSSTGGPGTSGVITAITRYDATGASIPTAVVDARTYGGDLEFYSNVAGVRTITFGAGTHNISGNLKIISGASQTSSFSVTGSGINQTINLTGDLSYTKGASATPAITSGTGVWTVSGNANFTNGSYTATSGNEFKMSGSGKSITNGQIFYKLTFTDNTFVDGATTSNAVTISSGKTLTLSGTLNATSASTITMTGATISGAGIIFYKNGANTFPSDGTLNVRVDFQPSSGAVTLPSRTYGGTVTCLDNGLALTSCTLTGTPIFSGSLIVADGGDGAVLTGSPTTVTVAGDVSGSSELDLGGTWTVSGNFDLSAFTTVSAGTSTVVLDGTGTLTTGGFTLNNLSLTPAVGKTLTLANATHAVAGNLVLGGLGVLTPGTSTMNMTGSAKTIDGGGKTLSGLTITDNTTLQNTDLTVSAQLAVANTKTLTINASRTVTLSGDTGTTLNLNTTGTVGGSTGTLVYQNHTTTVTTAGTISSKFTFDTLNGNETIPNRTFGGAVIGLNTTSSARTLLFDTTVTPTFSAGLDLQTSGSGTLLLDGATNNPTTVTVTGNFTTSTASGAVTVSLGSGNWAVSGNFDLTNVTTFNHNSGTVTLTGTGTLTSNGKTLNNLSVTNSSGTVTFANATHTLVGNLLFSGAGALSAGTSTVAMTGASKTIDGGGRTVSGLSISGDTTLQNTDLSVSGALAVADAKTLTINASRNLTVTTAGSVNFNTSGVITSPSTGTLVYQPSTTFPTGGTISSQLRMDATSNNQTLSARTYGGLVEPYSNSSSARTLTLGTAGSQTLTFSNAFDPRADGTGDLDIAGDTNNPAMTITGDVDFTGTGNGFEVIAAGTGTWTVSGNVDLTNGIYGPSVYTLSPSASNTAEFFRLIDSNSSCAISDTYSCLGSGVIQYGKTDDGGNCALNSVDQNIYTDRGWMEYNLAGISGSATILGAQVGATVNSTYSSAVSVARSTVDDLAGQNCTISSGTFSKISSNQYGTVSLNVAGNKMIPLGTTGAADIQTRIATTDLLSIGLNDSTTEGGMGALSTPPPLYVTYYASGAPTLTMNGSGKTLTTAGNSLYNLNISGTITLANETDEVFGDVNLTGSTITPGTSTLAMNGSGKTLIGGSATLNNLTIAANTTHQTSDSTVAGTLTVNASTTLTITGVTLSNTGSSNVALNGTISGTGTLRFTSASGGPGASGVLSTVVRFDATGGNIGTSTVDARTYGGTVEYFDNSGSAHSMTLPTGTFVYSGAVTTTESGAGSLSLDLNTNDPTSTFNGTLTIGANTTLSANSANALNLKGNYTNNGAFTDNGGTVSVNGTSQQTLAGTMTGSSDFNHLTISNTSGSDPDSSPSVIFSAAADTAGTFTAATANVKLRFNAGSTYTLAAINFSGTTGNLVTLRSSTPGTTVLFNAGAGSRTVTYTSVKDNDACGSTGGAIDASDGTNQNEGNTKCWLFQKLTVTLSANSIALGAIDTSTVKQGSIISTVTTTGASGYVSLVEYDHTLSNGVTNLTDAGGSITNGTAGYGASSSKASQTISQTTSSCSSGAGTFNATGLSTSFKSFASASGTVSGDGTTLCVLATPGDTSSPGSYTSTLTIVTTGRY